MTILVVEPMKPPTVQEIDSSLESMQKIVGGDIEAVYPFDDPVALLLPSSAMKKGKCWAFL